MKFEKWAWTKRDLLLRASFFTYNESAKIPLLDDVDLAENEKRN